MSCLIAPALVLSLLPLRLYGLKAGGSCQTSSSLCHVKWCPEKECNSTSHGIHDVCESKSTTIEHSKVVATKSVQDEVKQPKSIWISRACAEIQLVSVKWYTDVNMFPWGFSSGPDGTYPDNLTAHWWLKCGDMTDGCSGELPSNINDGDKKKYSYAIASKVSKKSCPENSCRLNVCQDKPHLWSDKVKVMCTEITYKKTHCQVRDKSIWFPLGRKGTATIWISSGSWVDLGWKAGINNMKAPRFFCREAVGCLYGLTHWQWLSEFGCER